MTDVLVFSPGLTKVCEHNDLNIQCGKGKVITVTAANYGRTSNNPNCGGPIKTTSCNSSGALSKVSSECSGKQNCMIKASNSVFGDPCVGTKKYLEVTYECKGNKKNIEFA